MLDRILKQMLWSTALAGSLVTIGCGTATSPLTAADETPAVPPRILKDIIVEKPPLAEAEVAQPGPADSTLRVVDRSPAPTNEIGRVRLTPRYRPSPLSETARVDVKVMPVGADEVSPIATSLPAAVAPGANRGGLPPPQQLPALKPQHSPQLNAVLQKAESHNHQGFALASRGACFSARAEFIQALRTISQGLDSEMGSADYGRALAAGMRALEEAEDFMPRSARLDSELDVGMLARAHRTPVLHEVTTPDFPPAVATQQYQRYAVEQLSAAIDGEAAGSLALHSLGKVYGLFARDTVTTTIDPQGKAIVFQRAALRADPKNYLAANELAVLLAQCGAYGEARGLLLRAIAINPRPAMWHNLAVVHAQLGETQLADLAHRTALSAAGGANPGNVQAMAALQAVRWVDPVTFTQMSPPPADLNPAPLGTKSPAPAPIAAPAGLQKGIMTRWAPWGTRQQ